MQPSLFLKIVDKYYPGLVVAVYDEIITKNEYSFMRDLRTEFSIAGTWQTLYNVNKNIMADVISLDASIPLKRAVGTESASGEIPKVATKRFLNETDLTFLQLLIARDGEDTEQVRRQLFDHVTQVILGQLERYEYMYLQSLSNEGVILVDENTNVGTGIRVDFGIPTNNKKHASVVWGNAGYTPLTDIADKIVEPARANGHVVSKLKMDRATFDKIRTSDEAKTMVFQGVTAHIAPNSEQLKSYLLAEFGLTVELQDKVVVAEINGVQTTVNPWKAGQIIATPDGNLGSFVWAEVAEMNFQSEVCRYQRVGNSNFILVKKYRTVEPSLAEWTASESRGLPVLGAVDRLYTLDTTAVS